MVALFNLQSPSQQLELRLSTQNKMRQPVFEDLEIAVAEAQAQSDAVEMATPCKKRESVQRDPN